MNAFKKSLMAALAILCFSAPVLAGNTFAGGFENGGPVVSRPADPQPLPQYVREYEADDVCAFVTASADTGVFTPALNDIGLTGRYNGGGLELQKEVLWLLGGQMLPSHPNAAEYKLCVSVSDSDTLDDANTMLLVGLAQSALNYAQDLFGSALQDPFRLRANGYTIYEITLNSSSNPPAYVAANPIRYSVPFLVIFPPQSATESAYIYVDESGTFDAQVAEYSRDLQQRQPDLNSEEQAADVARYADFLFSGIIADVQRQLNAGRCTSCIELR